MGNASRKMRLDEILIKEGLISEAQVKDALMRQKAHGGKFGSQLLYHRYIDEAGLVKALATQFACEGVVLSNLTIPDVLLKMVPKKVAVARKVVPFDYDVENNMLKIACEDPEDTNLINELNFVARGKIVKLYVAAEIALNTAIARHYLNQDVTLEDNLLLEIPDSLTDTGKISIPNGLKAPEKPSDLRPALLLVTDEAYAAPILQSLFERDNFKVTVVESVTEARERLEDAIYNSVLIKAGTDGNVKDLSDRIRRISPRTHIHVYENTTALLLNRDSLSNTTDLLIKNLELFTSLLTSKAHLPTNHGGRVGQYTNRLCGRLGLPEQDRLLITNIAYIHNLARYYYNTEEEVDGRGVTQLTHRLLTSLNYFPTGVEMLRLMYCDLEHEYVNRMPLEVLGANILTIVDIFCDSVPQCEQISLDKFDAIKKKLRSLSGTMFLPEVVESFVEMIQEEILDVHTTRRFGQVMIYASDLALQQPLELRLKNDGFRILSHSTVESFIELYKRGKPDLMIVVIPDTPDKVLSFINKMADQGIGFGEIPTFLLTESSSISRLTNLLERGIEDIIALDDNLDLLVTKIRKLQSRLSEQAGGGQGDGHGSGARGRLADMNLIDLIQALGPGQKTVRIQVQSNSSAAGPLVVFLNRGQIIYAQHDQSAGPAAVYEGLTWTDGTWTIDPVLPEELPEPNSDQSNESILMEGCRLLDERVKSGNLL